MIAKEHRRLRRNLSGPKDRTRIRSNDLRGLLCLRVWKTFATMRGGVPEYRPFAMVKCFR
jgi:hypothetical protein